MIKKYLPFLHTLQQTEQGQLQLVKLNKTQINIYVANALLEQVLLGLYQSRYNFLYSQVSINRDTTSILGCMYRTDTTRSRGSSITLHYVSIQIRRYIYSFSLYNLSFEIKLELTLCFSCTTINTTCLNVIKQRLMFN